MIKGHRERQELSQEELAKRAELSVTDINKIENGDSPLKKYAPLLLAFSEAIDQPIFNLFYPCGLPVGELGDYP